MFSCLRAVLLKLSNVFIGKQLVCRPLVSMSKPSVFGSLLCQVNCKQRRPHCLSCIHFAVYIGLNCRTLESMKQRVKLSDGEWQGSMQSLKHNCRRQLGGWCWRLLRLVGTAGWGETWALS